MKKWKNITERVEAYLSVRRNMGYKMTGEGIQLANFARFAANINHAGPLTLGLVLSWANASKNKTPISRGRRLEVVRGLAKYCALFEEETEIPASGLLGPAHRRLSPHIFTQREVLMLLKASKELDPRNKLRPASMYCIFGLLAATGMRVSEVLGLQRADINWSERFITVRESKYRKSRYVPVHPTTIRQLKNYAKFRDRQLSVIISESFFLHENGKALNYRQVLYAYQCIRSKMGWELQSDRKPRIHDLRHTFTCRRLLIWYEEGVDVNWALPFLSVYLGHAKVTDTYWYLTGIPALLGIAGGKFENFKEEPGANHG